MWRIYRGLTPGRAALRFGFPCAFGAAFVIGGVAAIPGGGFPVLAVGGAIFCASAYGLYRGARNVGKSLEAIAAEESGVVAERHAAEDELRALYRQAARIAVDDASIDLTKLPLPMVRASAGEALAVRLPRVESRRHEIGTLVAIQSVFSLAAGAIWIVALRGSMPATLIAIVTTLFAIATLATLVAKLRAFRVPEPIVEIDREPAALGEPLSVRVLLPGPAPRARVDIRLRAEEISVVHHGKTTTTNRELLSDGVVLADTTARVPAGATHELRGSILAPRSPPSFVIETMRIEWTIVVRRGVRDADAVEDRFLLRLLPPVPGTIV